MKKVLMVLMLAMAPMALAKTAQSCGYKNGDTTKAYCGGQTYSSKDFTIIQTSGSVEMSPDQIKQLDTLLKSVQGKKLACKCPKKLMPGATLYRIYKK